MMANVADNMKVDVAGETTQLSDSALDGVYYDMKEWDRGAFLANLADPATAPSVQLDLLAATDDVGSDEEVVATFTAGLADLASDVKALVEFRTEDLPDGKPFAALRVTELDGALATIDVTIVAALHNPHHSFENVCGVDVVFQTWD